MLAYFSPNRRLFGRAFSTVPQGDEIPLSRIDTTLPFQELRPVDQDDSTGTQEVHSHLHFLSSCYLLHAFLIIIHLFLAVVAHYHPEHHIVISTASKAFTVGLSSGLQAFYTLYAALLVFFTQRLMLSTVFSGPTKLTQVHDICGAWCGLGAALSTLWQQTKVASSIFSIALVTVYFIGVWVLHVASSTMMQFQSFNESRVTMVSAVSTWPDPISKFTSASNWDTAAFSLSPFMQVMYGDTTLGLANNTLYDIPVSSFVNATVNATTLNAQCGLLTNLSTDNKIINVSMTGFEHLTFSLSESLPLALPNQVRVALSTNYAAQPLITYLITAEIESDESVSGTSHVYINGTFSSSSGDTQNFTTKTYIAACTLNITTTTASLKTPNVLARDGQPTSVTWPMFSRVTSSNPNFTRSIMWAMEDGFYFPSLSPSCLPVTSEPYWQNMTTFAIYLSSSLGINVPSCNGTPVGSVEQYIGTPYLLTRDKIESVTSQIAAQFVWIAGQLGEAEGGFDRQMGHAQTAEYVLKWRLNVNLLPVIFSLCASVILFVLVVCMLRLSDYSGPIMQNTTAGPLEIMWFGSRSVDLRDYMRGFRNPSMGALRNPSIFKTVAWGQSPYVSGHLDPFHDLTNHALAAIETFSEHVHVESFQTSSQIDRPCRIWSTLHGRRWCYVLHIVLVFLNVTLLLLLVRHPEHNVIIPLETTIFTTGLSALLQAIYTLYSTLLVFVLQYLSFSMMVGERKKLTTVHDVCGAWTGIGAATLVLWKQRKLASSPWEVLAVVVYLGSMLVLHIASSSVMGWQAFENTLPVGLQSNLALPDSALNITQLEWSQISLIARSTNQDLNLSTYGLSSSTIYDIPQLPENATALEATVNATMFTTQCGLVPNLTVLSEYLTPSAYQYQIGFSLNGSKNNTLLGPTMWKDLLLRIDGQCAECPQTLFYMLTTAIDVDESVRDPVALNLTWAYPSSSSEHTQYSTTVAYVAACSVSTSTVSATLNLQEHKLVRPPNQVDLSESTSWSVWSPATATNLNVGMVTALSQSQLEEGGGPYPYMTYTTFMDSYLMTLLGLNTSIFQTQSSANPSVKLTPAQLEGVVSQTAARFMWFAGQLGGTNGGFDHMTGQSPATQVIMQYRLNINTIPVIFASAASFVALAVAIIILGIKPIKQSTLSISGMGVLESLWLEANSEEIHARLQAIDEPDPDKLREAGMFPIRLRDVKAGYSPQTSESEESPLANDSENVIDDGIGDLCKVVSLG